MQIKAGSRLPAVNGALQPQGVLHSNAEEQLPASHTEAETQNKPSSLYCMQKRVDWLHKKVFSV